ncbi:hypothetical protein IMSAGC022_01357 [Alistipes sp.]|nr:hypothetical protein IMSAGC022_01357 [Alistipes sp.]
MEVSRKVGTRHEGELIARLDTPRRYDGIRQRKALDRHVGDIHAAAQTHMQQLCTRRKGHARRNQDHTQKPSHNLYPFNMPSRYISGESRRARRAAVPQRHLPDSVSSAVTLRQRDIMAATDSAYLCAVGQSSITSISSRL